MKKLKLSVILMLICISSIIGTAYADNMSKYIGEYYNPINLYRSWFGYELKILDITDEYVEFDYQYSKPGHAIVYTAEKAYFTGENVAAGKGTWAFGDTPDDASPVDYEFVFFDEYLELSVSHGDEPGIHKFYLNNTGDFRSSVRDYSTDISTIVTKDKLISVADNELVITNLTLHENTTISKDVFSDFISDGNYVYYREGEQNVYRLNLNTYEKEYLFAALDACLDDCLDNKYLLYFAWGSPAALCVFDIENKTSHIIEESVWGVGFCDDRVIYTDGVQDYSGAGLYSSDIYGNDKRVISDRAEASNICIIDDYIYYAELTKPEYGSFPFTVKRCDKYGEAYCKAFEYSGNAFVRNVTAEYVEHEPENTGERKNYSREYYDFNKYGIQVTLNNNNITFDQPPVMKNDRVMVPIRAIFEALGFELKWNEAAKTAVASKDDKEITVTIGNNIIKDNKHGDYECDTAPIILSDRILVPVRAIAETADCIVNWDNSAQTVLINN